ncbi:MAG: M24 family metallopeptidase [Ilumatobacteraceae bacterium]
MTNPDFGRRLERLMSSVGTVEVLITDPEDIRWLTGFTGSNGWVLATTGGTLLVTDGRYVDQAAAQCSAAGTRVELARGRDEMIRIVADHSVGPIGFQDDRVTVALHRDIAATISGLEPVGARLLDLRRCKDRSEIDTLTRAARIADRALNACSASITPGRTEREIRDDLEAAMRRFGADGPSYETIVATGTVNSARPHHRPTDEIVREGDSLVIDVGALVQGYHSDMTRTFLLGPVDPELDAWWDLVRHAQEEGCRAVGPGVPAREVDEACRRVFRTAGVEDRFVHGTGHGVGLLIHEEPFLGRTSEAILASGDVVTVEPGLYRDGLGGVRIEDLLVVTDDGFVRLTGSDKTRSPQ